MIARDYAEFKLGGEGQLKGNLSVLRSKPT